MMQSGNWPASSEPPNVPTAHIWPSSAKVTSSRPRTGRPGMPSTSSGCADGSGGIVDVERARAPLPAERREIEQALSRRGHQEDGDDRGWLKPRNLAVHL